MYFFGTLLCKVWLQSDLETAGAIIKPTAQPKLGKGKKEREFHKNERVAGLIGFGSQIQEPHQAHATSLKREKLYRIL